MGPESGYVIKLPSQISSITTGAGILGVNLIRNIIGIMFFIAILLAFGFIIFGGFKWIISQGDPKSITSARETIIYASVGLFVAALSLFLINILGIFFNIPLIR